MKSLIGLPPSAYLKVSQEANVALSDLPQLVQELENGSTPAFLAHHRPDLGLGLSEIEIRAIENRLRQFLDLEDRRITVLTAIGRRDQLTPEVRERVESAMDRWELDDLYLPYKPRRGSAADQAIEAGLEPLARIIGEQANEGKNIEQIAEEYVNAERGIADARQALRGARAILARQLAEDAEIRKSVRELVRQEAQIVVDGDAEAANRGKRKYRSLIGYRAKVRKVAWRQMMAIRRAAQEAGLSYEVLLPENKVVALLLAGRLEKRRDTTCLQIGAAAREAFHQYLAPAFAREIVQRLNERCDSEAILSYQKMFRRILMTPAAGLLRTVGIETGRPGGWRAAVVDTDGRFLEGAIIFRDGKNPKRKSADAETTTPETTAPETTGPESADPEHSETSAAPSASEANEPDHGAESAVEESASESSQSSPPLSGAPEGEAQDAAAAAAEVEAPAQDEATPAADQSAAAPSGDEQSGTAQAQQDHGEGGAGLQAPAPSESPTPGQPLDAPAEKKGGKKPGRGEEENVVSLAELLAKHQVQAVAMANGAGIRQVERLVRSAVREAGVKDVFWTTVHDAGSWIYASSKHARRGMTSAPVAQRSAACLARRLQDPLREFVLIDPRASGIGQFHQDVDQRRLRNGLLATLEAVLHEVGVDLNTAPAEMLALVPGLTERAARRVVEHREKIGGFRKREQLKDVSGLSDRVYEQAAGFTRVRGGENPLDDTGLHPLAHPAMEKILASAGLSAAEALENPEALDAVPLEELQDRKFPAAVLRHLVGQMHHSARYPREPFVPPKAPVELRRASELPIGGKVEGVVSNVADFGVFVDIGAEQDGLLHLSRLSGDVAKDPKTAMKPGDRIEVYVEAVERDGKRISLSMRAPAARQSERNKQLRERQDRRPGDRRPGDRRPGDAPRGRRKQPRRETTIAKRLFGPDEKAKAREEKELRNLSMNEKLALLQSKYQTKV